MMQREFESLRMSNKLKTGLENLTDLNYETRGVLIGQKNLKKESSYDILGAYITGVGEYYSDTVDVDRTGNLENIWNLLTENKGLIYKEFHTHPKYLSGPLFNHLGGFSQTDMNTFLDTYRELKQINPFLAKNYSSILIEKNIHDIVKWGILNDTAYPIKIENLELNENGKIIQDIVKQELIDFGSKYDKEIETSLFFE